VTIWFNWFLVEFVMRLSFYDRSFSSVLAPILLLSVIGGLAGCGAVRDATPSWSLMGQSDRGVQTGALPKRNWNNAPPPANNNWATQHKPKPYTYTQSPTGTEYLTPPHPAPRRYQPPIAKAQPAPAPQSPPQSVLVRHGDTLSAISRRTGVSVSQLFALNKLPTDHIYPGQVILLR